MYDSLYHHGVKGMKWGVRRYQNADGSLTPAGVKRYQNSDGSLNSAGRKFYAKQNYKTAKKTASKNLYDARALADEQYKKDMSERTEALDRVANKYKRKDDETNRYYDKEIDKFQKMADKAKSEMDFWENPDSMFYQEASQNYIAFNNSINDLKVRRDSVTMANKIARDNETIQVRELYADSAATANSRRQAAYVKAGEEYVASLRSAKATYKEAKKK